MVAVQYFTTPLSLVHRSNNTSVIAAVQYDPDYEMRLHQLHDRVTKRHLGAPLIAQYGRSNTIDSSEGKRAENRGLDY